MDEKEKRESKEIPTSGFPKVLPKGKELKVKSPEPMNEKPLKGQVEKAPPKVEPIKLTKSQLRLYRYWADEIMAIKIQTSNAIDMVGSELKKMLVETFADELNIDLSERKYGFDPQSQSFIDLNELRARIAKSRMRNSGGRP